MLVLTRKQGQRVIIPTPLGPLTVTVSEVDGEKVRLGFEGNDQIEIYREEVFERMNKPDTVGTVWGRMPVGNESRGS
jgi:carbon storage regulator CsrA